MTAPDDPTKPLPAAGGDLPTEPMPASDISSDGPAVAPHVPVADVPTEEMARFSPSPPPRGGPGRLVAVVGGLAAVAVVAAVLLATFNPFRAAAPVETPADTPTPVDTPVDEEPVPPPAPEPPDPEPTPPPQPEPTITPVPEPDPEPTVIPTP